MADNNIYFTDRDGKEIKRPIIMGLPVPKDESGRGSMTDSGMTVEQLMAASVLDLRKIYPLLFAALHVIPRIESEEVGAISVSMDKIYYNSHFLEKVTRPQLTFFLIHGLYHILMRHHIRGTGKNPFIWNKACDLYINKCIQNAFGADPTKGNTLIVSDEGEHVFIEMPEGETFDAGIDVEKDTPEIIYAMLIEEQEDEKESDDKEQDEKSDDPGTGGKSGKGGMGDKGTEGDFGEGDKGQGSSDKSEGKGGEHNSDEEQDSDDSSEESSNENTDDEKNAENEDNENGGSSDESDNNSGDSGSDPDKENGGSDNNENNPDNSSGSSDTDDEGSNDEDRDPNGSGDSSDSDNENSDDTNLSQELSDEDRENDQDTDAAQSDTDNTNGNDRNNDLIDDSDSRKESPTSQSQKMSRLLSKIETIRKQLSDAKQGRGMVADPVAEAEIRAQDINRVNWRALIRNKLIQITTDEKSLSHPDRRFVYKGLYLEGPVIEENQLSEIKLCVDTSASISDVDVQVALLQISDLLKTFNLDADLVFWDEEIEGVIPFTNAHEFELARKLAKGRGGTHPDCIFEAFEQTNRRGHVAPQPSLVIIFTDGCFDPPDIKYKRAFDDSTIWVLSPEDSKKEAEFDPGFGKVVVL